MNLPDRFWAKVDRNASPPAHAPQLGPCWIWNGATAGSRGGYGSFGVGSVRDGSRRMAYAHRLTYEAFVGQVPEGRELDHVCRNRRCVNPRHLEPITHSENILRGAGPAVTKARHAARTGCVNGHAFDAENTRYVRRPDGSVRSRQCRACARERNRARRAGGSHAG